VPVVLTLGGCQLVGGARGAKVEVDQHTTRLAFPTRDTGELTLRCR
jgi:hypothetical protein